MAETPDEAFARLASDLSEAATVAQTAAQIVDFGTTTIGTQFAGIMMMRRRRTFETVVSSAPVVLEADGLQQRLREGPGVDPAMPSRTIMSADLARDTRWPRWGPVVVDLGLVSVLSAELRAAGQRIGVINFYGDHVRQFTEQDAHVASLFASHAAAALAAVTLRENLQNALDSRTIVGQAQGVLMERFDVDADRAFTILRRYSQDGNVKLTDVARALVDSRELPGTSPGLR
ncbi:GAF and ANTAR domain-containing protein [Aeromicrobium sp. CFBP 8757]|uniref:GAF and ANTAR domain-containing protein n=1 Tax=Aeromicrobium sp. CFBP 8757 TaxID=2775288 RepID=UPI00177C2149|nr:GAF and ANTAR domain-containing protein [Aeromicrobium sp. CFBP 8757]MBD8605836.1 GAF and ANTAR domain-containing protein [Aeromicrobium sp. CFBP 8757]